MRVLLALILIFGLLPREEELVVKEKTISVNGQTSVGNFKCNYWNAGFKDTLFINQSDNQKPVFFKIPVHDFACGNFLLNRDFRKTLKADEFPYASVKVNNVRRTGRNYKCDLTVNIVGKRLDFKGLELQNGNNELKGNIVLNFAQLGLTTPKKLGGLIKVEEKLALEIRLGL